MKLFEKIVYVIVLFVFVYVVLSMGLRMFSLTSDYNSHMIGGVAATISAMLLFMYLLVVKQEN